MSDPAEEFQALFQRQALADRLLNRARLVIEAFLRIHIQEAIYPTENELAAGCATWISNHESPRLGCPQEELAQVLYLTYLLGYFRGVKEI